MRDRKTINFTQGSIAKAILQFAVPIIAGELLQNLYNSVDSLVVGNFVGSTALAATGVCSTLTQLLVGFFTGMSVGSTVVVSKAFGKGDETELRQNIRYTFTFSSCLGIVVTVLAILFSRFLLRVSGANEEVFAEALLYFQIYLIGLPFTVAYNSGAGILRAMGDSRSPFLVLTATSGLNVIFDLLFTGLMHMGIAGVAAATVLSQTVSAVFVYCIISSRIKCPCIDLRGTFLHGREVIGETISIGFWAGMQSAMICFSNLFVWRYINRFETLQVAGVSIGNRVDKFVNLPLKAYGIAMTTYIGQNRGAKNEERIRKGIVHSLLLALETWLLFGTAMYAGAGLVARCFNRDPLVLETAVHFLRTLIPFYCLLAVREILLGILRGFGKSTGPMVMTLIGMIGIRQIYLYFTMRPGTDIQYLFYVYPIGWFAAASLLLLYTLAVRRQLKV